MPIADSRQRGGTAQERRTDRVEERVEKEQLKVNEEVNSR